MFRATRCWRMVADHRYPVATKHNCNLLGKSQPRRLETNSAKKNITYTNNATTEGTSLLSASLAWYATKLDTHPIMTKCISSGLVSGAGDMICQYLTPADESDSSTWDMIRTGRFAFLGAFWVGPVLHYWYGSLALLTKNVWVRVAVDQFAMAPLFVTSFLSWLWWMEGEPPKQLPTRIQENVPEIVVANWSLWIPAQAVNFNLVPVKYHVLFSNMVGLIWNAYLSYTSHHLKPTKIDEETKVDEEAKVDAE